MATTETLLPPLHHQHHFGGGEQQHHQHNNYDPLQTSSSNSQNSQTSVGGVGGGNGGSNRSRSKPRRIVFYKNGDRYFGGKVVTVPANRHYSIRDLMTDLNKSVDLPYGVRRVYTPVSGREINSIDELVDGSSYVCASFEPFRSVRYGVDPANTEKNWNVHPNRQQQAEMGVSSSQHLPNSLPTLTTTTTTSHHHNNHHNSNSYYLPRHYIKTIPLNNTNGYVISTNPNNPSYPSQKRSYQNMPPSLLQQSLQQNQPLSNRSQNNNNNNLLNPQQQQQQQYTQQQQHQVLSQSEAWSKPRLVTIIRATDRPRKRITILLNRKALHSFEQFICDISEAFGLPQWKNDKIRKLVTVRGRKVQGISDFFRDDDVFIGVSGKEPLKKDLVVDLLGEIYPDSEELVQALCKDWEASRSRSRVARNRNTSVDHGVAALKDNNNNNNVNNTNNNNNAQNLSTSEDHLLENGKKSKYGVEFDENGKRKKKKKVADSDILLEMELQRQRERLKLIELERKKRELNSNSRNEKENHHNNHHNQNHQKHAGQKRVNIVTPNSENNQQQQQQHLNQSQSENHLVETSKKVKRKPKYKKSLNNNNNNNNQTTPQQVEENETTQNKQVAHHNRQVTPLNERDEAELVPQPPVVDLPDTNQSSSRNNNAKSKSPKRGLSPQPQPASPHDNNAKEQPTSTSTSNKNLATKSSISNQQTPHKLKRQVSNASHVTDKYEFIKTLGDGNFAVVKQARQKSTDHEYAIKIIDKSKMKGKENMIDNEIYIMKSCNHSNIVKLYEAYETKDEVYLVTDLVKGGDLFDAITQSVKFNEKDASGMVQDVCEALFYLHSKNIVHRDLKPENLLVMRKKDDRINIKLADFGLAMEVKEPIFTVCGTPTYVAPEILAEIGYGLEVDMWACGVITYILLCGFPPFRSLDRNQEELFQYIQDGEYEYLMPYWEGISESSKDLIDNLLVVDIKKRWKAEDVLMHPWIVSHGNSKPLPPNFDEFKKNQLKDLKSKASVYAAEPFASK